MADGKMDHDDSFPFALDENLHRISAMEAILWKRRDPNVIFYCPKCVQIDPDHKTIVRPSSHKIPRFNRKRGESHLPVCQFGNATKYMEYLADQFQIPLNQKELRLTIPPYQAGAFLDRSLQTRRSIFDKEEHQKLVPFFEILLQDYEMDLFYQRYGQYQIFDGKNRLKLKNFIQTMETKETKKTNSLLAEEKLNLIIGTIYEVEWSDRYLIAIFDNTQVEYTLSLYFHPYHYPKSTLDLLKNRRIACLGYVQKIQEREYQIEILSIDHQIAFLDGPRPSLSLSPTLNAEILLDHLLLGTEIYTPLEIKRFKRSYYANQLQQFDRQYLGKEQKKQERLNQTFKQIPKLNEKLLELKVAKEQLELDLDNHQKSHTTFLPRLRDMLLFRGSRVKLREQDIQQGLEALAEKIEQTITEMRQLKKERSLLKKELSQIHEKRRSLVQKQKKEKKIKKKMQGYLYEYELGSSRGIVIGLCPKADRFNVEVEVTLFDVHKREGYYLPDSKTRRTFATDGFSGEREIQVMIRKVWRYINEQIREIVNKVKQDDNISLREANV